MSKRNMSKQNMSKRDMLKQNMSKRTGSKTDQFWDYAKEALLSACNAKTDEDKQGLLELARTWTQAALQQRGSTTEPSSAAR
jgi:hypothetical protein